jgi:hypothetical protein
MHLPTQERTMSTLEFWIRREGACVVLGDGELQLILPTEGDAIDAAVRIAKELDALCRITYARHVGD